MSPKLYSLPGGDGDETKVWYSLDFGMGIRMIFLRGWFVLRRWVCDSETCPCPASLPSLVLVLAMFLTIKYKTWFYKCYILKETSASSKQHHFAYIVFVLTYKFYSQFKEKGCLNKIFSYSSFLEKKRNYIIFFIK